MKKFYVYAAALALSFGAQAQSTFTFESHTLASESFDNGSAGNGDFIFTESEEIGMTNYYDMNGGWWSGFSISNITDNTTAGWTNQYSAYPGSGAAGSANYAVFSYAGSVYGTNQSVVINEFKIANASYAALSMRDGDFFGKQFGSPLNAQGNPDGTNGEDFFKVWILCNGTLGEVDSMEFYLADYRFADSTLDYILDTWETIDLSAMPFDVNSVDFRLESSDNDSVVGMNTPAYFAIDDIKTETVIIGLEEVEMKMAIYPNPATENVRISGSSGRLTISDATGRVVYEGDHMEHSSISVENFTPSVYVIRLESASGSYTNQLIVQ